MAMFSAFDSSRPLGSLPTIRFSSPESFPRAPAPVPSGDVDLEERSTGGRDTGFESFPRSYLPGTALVGEPVHSYSGEPSRWSGGGEEPAPSPTPTPGTSWVAPEFIRASALGGFDPAYAQNLATYIGGLFARPEQRARRAWEDRGTRTASLGRGLWLDPFAGELPGEPVGGGNAPLLGLPRGLLQEALLRATEVPAEAPTDLLGALLGQGEPVQDVLGGTLWYPPGGYFPS